MSSAAGRALRLAHRGDHRRVPENTVAAFRAAMAWPGCDGVELDVRAAADGAAIVLHDATLERVFGRPERAAELPAAALGAIGVPTLAEVLDALPATAVIDVELKEDVADAATAAIASARGDPPAGIVLSSFDEAVLAAARSLAPAWPRWLNAVDLEPATLQRARDVGCAAVSVEWHALDERSIRRARDAGLLVAAWTVRRRATVARLARLGVDALCLEGPALDPAE